MALTGQLSDMSLAELIEFFCNQRKTGRLKIDYPRGHSVFFIKDGELVDAKVGALSGTEAVFYSLTLPNAAFDFSPEVLPTRRTINEPWTQVVLEGLRRLDEGLSPTEQDAFGGWVPSESDMAMMMDHVDRLGEDSDDMPMFMTEGSGTEGGNRRKWMIMGVAASVVLVCAVAAIPLMGGSSKPAETAAAPAATQPAADPAPSEAPTVAPDATTTPSTDPGTDAARREREERDRKERERREKEKRATDAAKKDAANAATTAAAASAGPKTVRVTVFYDENGRVTQASVAGASPGAEAFGGTAVRVARGKRFPAGKAGSTVVTIPVN